jgi:hypothetical protein
MLIKLSNAEKIIILNTNVVAKDRFGSAFIVSIIAFLEPRIKEVEFVQELQRAFNSSVTLRHPPLACCRRLPEPIKTSSHSTAIFMHLRVTYRG